MTSTLFYYWTVPICVFILYILASLELLAEEIENPFGTDPNDLPVDDICDNIKKNIQEKNKAKELIQVEFDKKISKQKLENISGVSRAKSIGETSWLIESSSTVDLRSSVAKFAAKNELLILTLKKEEDKLEDIFKKLTN